MVERRDNGGGPATAYREEYTQREMPEREEFNREEFFGTRAPGSGAVLTGDNISPTVREEFNRDEFFGRQVSLAHYPFGVTYGHAWMISSLRHLL